MSTFEVTLKGSLAYKDCDINNLRSGATPFPAMIFHRKGLESVIVQNITTNTYVVRKIELTIDSKAFATITFASNHNAYYYKGSSYEYSLYNETAPTRVNSATTLTGNYNGKFYTRNEYLNGFAHSYTTNITEMISFNESGMKHIKARIHYSTTYTTTGNTVEEIDLNIGVNVYDVAPSGISIITTNVKKDYELNEPFSFENLIVSVSTKYQVCKQPSTYFTTNSYKISTPDMNTVGAKTIVVTYGTFNATYQITVGVTETYTLNVDFSSIESNKYFHGDPVDFSNITGVFTIDSKISSDYDDYPKITNLTPNELRFILNGNEIKDLETYKLPASAQTTTHILKVEYDHTKNYGELIATCEDILELTAYTPSLQSISFNKTEKFKELDTYIEGQDLSLAGLTFNLVYDKTSSNVSNITYNNLRQYGATLYLGENEISSIQTLSTIHDGKVLKVVINDKECVVGTLKVAKKEIVEIHIDETNSKHKTNYTYGDTFTLDRLIVYAKYNNDDEVLLDNSSISAGADLENHTFSKTDFTSAGETKTVTLTFNNGEKDFTTSYTITFNFPIFDHADLDTSKIVTTFENGTVYSDEGLIVYAVFANGYKEKLSATHYTTNANTILKLNDDNIIDVSDDTGAKHYGEKSITIKVANPYNSSNTENAVFEKEYKVSIIPSGTVVSAYLDFEPDKYKNYTVGDKYNAKGVFLKLEYLDGTKAELSLEGNNEVTTIPQMHDTLRSAQKIEVTVIYMKGEFSTPLTYSIIVNIANVQSNSTPPEDYRIAIGDVDGKLFETLTYQESTITLGKQKDNSCIYPIFHKDQIKVDDEASNHDTFGYNVYTGSNPSKDCIGYMDLGLIDDYGNLIRNSHIVLFEDVLNPIEGDGNIVVTYPHYVEGYSERINRCKFGKVYNKRLFVSGNPEYKNCDWHTSEINIAQTENYDLDSTKDFTYFSDLDYCRYGSDETAVVGYDIYRDGDLIVFKETSRNEATLYKRTSSLINAIDYAGNTLNNNLVEEAYPCFDINNNGGEGSFTPQTIVNFVGDTLFLTRSGLKVLSSKETTSNNAKYTYDVSSYINAKITNEQLENARLFAHKERLILKTKRGVYFGEYNLRNDNNEYEWYFIDNVNASLFFELDNELYFADNNGSICKFTKGSTSYVDIPRTFVSNGGALLVNEQEETADGKNLDSDGDGFGLDETNNKILISNKYASAIENGKTFHLITTYRNGEVDNSCLIHASLGQFINKDYKLPFNKDNYVGEIDIANNSIRLYSDSDNIDLYYSGRKIQIDSISCDTVPHIYIDKTYILEKVNDDLLDYSYFLIDEEGNKADFLGLNSMRLSFIVNDLEIAEITNVTEESNGGKTFELIGDHNKILDLIFYNNRIFRYSGVITDKQPVQAFYRTKPYNMGTTMYEKTVWSWVIANDSGLASSTDVGYITSRKQSRFDMSIESKEFKTSGFDFNNIQFTNDNLPLVFIKNRTLPNITFIEFIFKNDSDSNMVLSQFSLTYSISQLTRGVK